ncbi:MAG: DNA methylase, partial [Myxococcota bacterium]|nr:DNA methylase [Myxococcota bacterium]
DPVTIQKEFYCPKCSKHIATAACQRVVSSSLDPLTGETINRRHWEPVYLYGRSARGTWSRPITSSDLALIERVRAIEAEGAIPSGLIDWGDLHRSGYHTGITRFHHLYTARNFQVLSTLWQGIQRFRGKIADALRLFVLSYNSSHSTLMTRVVAKKNQKDFVITGAQSGVMYVSGLPVEKNILEGLRRKLKTFIQAFELTHGSRSEIAVVNGSSTRLHLDDNSVDYVFTDPPFGDFIPYAEVNQVNEAWLGKLTDRTEEAIISPSQSKGVEEYGRLMKAVFSETARVLRPTGSATVVFHASKPAVWNALGEAIRASGFGVELTSILDKTQVSFKQVVHQGGTRGDAIFLLIPEPMTTRDSSDGTMSLDRVISQLEIAAEGDEAELAPRRLYSRYVAYCIEASVKVVASAPEFYSHLSLRRGALPDECL